MIPQSLVVTIQMNGVSSKRIWDSREALTIGHPTRWVLERDGNRVSARAVSAASLKKLADGSFVPNEVPAPEKGEASTEVTLTETKLSTGISFTLPQSAVTVEISGVAYFAQPQSIADSAGTNVRVYGSRGDWNFDTQDLSARYTAMAGNQRVFVAENISAGFYRVTSASDALTLCTGKRSESFAAKLSREFSSAELARITLTFEGLSWSFQTIAELSAWDGANVKSAEITAETAEMQRARKVAGGIMLAFALLALLWPKPELITPLKEQVVELRLKKPAMAKAPATAAAQGDHRAKDHSVGEKKTASPRGTDMKKTQISKKRAMPKATVAKTEKTVTPRSAQKQKAAPVAKAAKAKPAQSRAAAPQAQKTAPQKALAKKAPSAAPVRAAGTAHRSLNPVRAQTAQANAAAQARANAIQHSELARAFGGKAFQSATRNALNGGAILRQRRYDGNAVTGGDSAAISPDVGGVNTHQGIGSRDVSVSTLGSSQGQFGVKGPGYGKGSNAAISGQGKSFVSLDTSESDVDGGLTRDQINAVIHRHMNEIRYCYDAARVRSMDVMGKVVVNFDVAVDGTVTRARAPQSTVQDSKLDACVLKHLASWKFPRSRSNIATTANYPFVFKPLVR